VFIASLVTEYAVTGSNKCCIMEEGGSIFRAEGLSRCPGEVRVAGVCE